MEADGGGEELIKPAEREALKVIMTCRAKSRSWFAQRCLCFHARLHFFMRVRSCGDALHCMLDCIDASGLAECVFACAFSPEPFVRQRRCLVPRSICLSFIGSNLICVAITCKGHFGWWLPDSNTSSSIHLYYTSSTGGLLFLSPH